MQPKPKRRNFYAFPYFFLGLFIAVVLVGIASVLYLIYQPLPVTISNLLQLHSENIFIYIDIIALYSALVFGLVGYQKDRTQDEHRYDVWLTQNQQLEIQKLQGGYTDLNIKHQGEITSFQKQLEDQSLKFKDLEGIIENGKQHWEATFDAVEDLIILTDETGRIIRCNRAVGQVFHLGFNQIIGQGIDELFGNKSANLVTMTPGEWKEMKFPHLNDWYETSRNFILFQGRQEGWVYIFRNITAQKHASQNQKSLTQYYELVVKNNPHGIVALNQDNQIVDCNPAFENMFLYSREEAIGAKVDALITPPELAFEANGMVEFVRKGGKVQCITQRRRKDGSTIDVELFGIPFIMSGKQVGALSIYHDVSDLVRKQPAQPGLYEQIPEERSGQMEASIEPAVEKELVTTPEAIENAEDVSTVIRSMKRLIPVEDIEGIGQVYAEKLSEVGIKTTDDLLNIGKDRKGREELVSKTGISSLLVLKWVNMADLMRIHGIGEEYSELLERAGVDTVKELRNRNPENLYDALVKTNATRKLVRRLPTLSEVEAWIKEAKESEPTMTY